MERNLIPKLDFEKIKKLQNTDFIGDNFAIFKDFPDISNMEFPIRLEPTVFAVTLSGEADFVLNSKNYHIGPKQLVVLMSEHIIGTASASPDFSALFLVITPQFAEECMMKQAHLTSTILYTIEHPSTPLSDEEFERLKESHQMLWMRARLTQHPFREQMARSLLTSVFYDAMGLFDTHASASNANFTRQEQIFASFLKLVSKSCMSERGVAYYAKQLCLTPKYLSTAIKEVSGRTALEWITEYTLLEAKSLLISTNMSIQEITYRLNFPNQSFFGKYFKHYTGMSPGQYRQQH